MASVHPGIVYQAQGRPDLEYLRLEEVSVKAWVVDVSSRIVLIQTFYNSSDEPTGRAKYVFPLPASSAVCAFELELEDGSVIVGEVKEKEEAAFTFNHALEQGRTTALVESVTDDIFTISVGSIPATARVTAYLTFVMDLLNEALRDQIRLQLPMYLAERYGTPPAAMQDASTADTQTRVRISVDIQSSDVIYDVRSSTHQIALRYYKGRSGQKSRRRMSAVWKSSEFLTGDFVITIHAEGLDKPRCFAEILGGGAASDAEGSTIAMQLTLVPKFLAPKVLSQEYIFLIDRSGSMSGKPIEIAKQTLNMLLRLLPTSQTTFNIFSFGSASTSLWRGSRGLDQTSLVEATLDVASMSADYGGTEIPMALQSALNSRGLDRPTVVFLLTDGQIQTNGGLDPFVVISSAIRNSPTHAPVRLFVLGIGDQVSSDVCYKLAREGNGEYLFALSPEEILGKCARLLNAGRSKNIERIDVDWGFDASSSRARASSLTTLSLPAGIPALAPPPPVQQAPHSLTKIFSGMRFTVFAIASFRTSPNTVRLTIKLDGVPEPQELTVNVTRVKQFRDTSEHSVVPMLHVLAARQLIMELDDRKGPLPFPAPGDALLVSEDDLRKAGIVRLGLAYQLMSKHTSFVAVQKGDERIRSRGGGSGSRAWIRSRLRRTDLHTRGDSSAQPPTFLDDLITTVSSFIASVFGFHSGAGAPTSMTNSAPHSRTRNSQQPVLPGAYEKSDSETTRDDESRGRRPAPSPTRSVASHHSANTFSTLSSIEGSSCSSCWTSSRSPSPSRRFYDQTSRADSPDIFRDPSTRIPGAMNASPNAPVVTSSRLTPVSQDVYNLFSEMDVDGSFAVTPLLTRLVGNVVLDKADEFGIDRKVWVTVVVTAYMNIHLQVEPDLLELLSEKAKEFVEARGAGTFEETVRKADVLLRQ